MPMTKKERIFHALAFEALFSVLLLLALKLFTNHAIHDLMLMIVWIALLTMIWNVVFNFLFDKLFTGARENRSVWVRVLHTVAFELGLLMMTLPLVAYILSIDLWAAFLMDLSMTIAVMVYGFCFNWAYDLLRLRFFDWQARQTVSI